MRFVVRLSIACGFFILAAVLLLLQQPYASQSVHSKSAGHQRDTKLLHLIPDTLEPGTEIANVRKGGYRYEEPLEICKIYSSAETPKVSQVTFNQEELRRYESGEKTQYHNVELTNITDDYVERLKPLLPKSDLKGLGSCALVFSSGSLRHCQHGELIDAHANVVRFNWAPVQGHESYAGSKTTILAGALHITSPIMKRARLAKGFYDRKNLTMIVASTRHHDIRDLVFGDDCPEHCGERATVDDWLLRFPSDDIQRLAQQLLCAVTDEGRLWVADSVLKVPTSGFIAVLMMLHACDAVSLFGANFVEGVDSYHYWEDSKAWPEVGHWFAMEHGLYKWWHSQGILRIYC